VLELMAEGCGRGEIARSLSADDGSFVSAESVKSIERRVVAKLRAGSLAHAVAVGLRSGLIL
jgi:DNA-binding CsgD family transcriptional regulator